MRPLVILLLLIGSAAAADGPKVVSNAIPPAAQIVPAAPGSLVTLTGEHNTRWQLDRGKPLGFWPDGPVCQIAAPSGSFLVLAITATDIKRYEVVFGGDPPGPMPPGPVPPGPAPVDPLKAKLESALAKDAPAKADTLKLASHYTAAASQVKLPTVTTAGQLVDAMKAVNPVNGRMLETQRVVAGELLAILKDLKTPLTDANRAATADLFTRAAAILNPKGE